MSYFKKPLKKLLILYIYLNNEFNHCIKTGELNTAMTKEERDVSTGLKENWFLRIVVRAFLLTFLVFFTIVYLHQGSLIFNADGSTIFNFMAAFELSATFVMLLSIFLAHRGISKFITSSTLGGFNSLAKGLMEAFLVVVTSAILLSLTILIPFLLLFPEIDIPPEKIRFNFIFIAIITLFFYYFVERERSKKHLQQEMLRAESLQKENFKAQLDNLKSQVSPHFLFNSLNVLSSLIQQDQTRATEFTQRLSDLYRAFLENFDHQLIPLEKEMAVVEDYIYLLKTRFGEAVQFVLNIPSEKLHLQVPPGSLQMLIENATKHNGSTRKKPLKIRIYAEDDHLVVLNNLQPRQEEVKSTRTGLENIKNRYKYLSNREFIFNRTEEEFRVELPLLKVENYENSDYRR